MRMFFVECWHCKPSKNDDEWVILKSFLCGTQHELCEHVHSQATAKGEAASLIRLLSLVDDISSVGNPPWVQRGRERKGMLQGKTGYTGPPHPSLEGTRGAE